MISFEQRLSSMAVGEAEEICNEADCPSDPQQTSH